VKKAVLYYLPPWLWIFFCLIPAYFPGTFFGFPVTSGIARIVHAGSYFVLCWLVHRAFVHEEFLPQLKKHSVLGSFIFSLMYGLLDEYHQDFLPDRSPSIYNFFAGVGGALLFVALLSLVSRKGISGGSEREG
jgi:VanZ family protein